MPHAHRSIIHVDMDAFFASVEQLDRPELRGRPVVVGGDSNRGVVCAASYEARPSGVRSAMSMVEAKRRCPDAVVIAPRLERYREVSSEVFSIFHEFTPEVQGLSLDEAFLDCTKSRSLFGEGEQIAARIRSEIRSRLSLTASAGVASSKFVAKVASDLRKPDRLVVVPPGTERAFLDPLPIRRMWGVGPKAAERLRSFGFETIGSLARTTPETLEGLVGSWGRQIYALAHGRDDRAVEPHAAAKSIGAEETFDENLTHVEQIEPHLLHQSRRVARRLVRSGQNGRTVTVKLKYHDHHSQTRRKTLAEPVCDTDAIYQAACQLLGRFENIERGIRLTGVAVSGFEDEAQQPSLFVDEERARREKLEAVANAIEDRFGKHALTRARLLEKRSPRDRD